MAAGADASEQISEILRAVRRRQPAVAERAMRAHLEHLLGVLYQVDEGDSSRR
jgi:DNA-binding GntR family transcriptional regulator